MYLSSYDWKTNNILERGGADAVCGAVTCFGMRPIPPDPHLPDTLITVQDLCDVG